MTCVMLKDQRGKPPGKADPLSRMIHTNSSFYISHLLPLICHVSALYIIYLPLICPLSALYSVNEKSSDIRTCPTFWLLCPTFCAKTSDIMSEEMS